MMSNEDTGVRVLDVPGFGDSNPNENLSTIEVNAGFVNAIVEVQNKVHVTFNRILYFLPFRGIPARKDAYLQDELHLLFQYFGYSIFQCMVMITTRDGDSQKELTKEQYEKLSNIVKKSLQHETGEEDVLCPPIVYLPLEASNKEILIRIQTAKVLNDTALSATGAIHPYKGEGKWEEWIKEFEAIALERSMGEKSKLQWFKSLLSGPVKSALSDIKMVKEYSIAKEKVSLHCFSTRSKKDYEKWSDVANDLLALSKQAFPGTTDDYRGDLVKKRILDLAKDTSLPTDESLPHVINILMAKDAIQTPFSNDSDGVNWDTWIKRFESIAEKNNLDDTTKLQWFQARLEGEAHEIFCNLQRSGNISYTLVRKALQAKVYSERFDTRGKKDSENVRDYAKKLQQLLEKAYPDDTDRENKVLLRIKEHLHESLKCVKWKSVSEAINANSAMLAITPFTYNHSEGWEYWIKFFDSKCKLYSLDDSICLLLLKNQLAGSALQCYNELPETLKEDYVSACNGFQTKLYKNTLEMRSKDSEDKHKYSGEENWEEWIKMFEQNLHKSDTKNEEEKIEYLKGHLKGNALEAFDTIPFSSLYSEIRDQIKRAAIEMKFKKEMKMFKDWKSYADDLVGIGKQIYDDDKLTEMVIAKILPNEDHGIIVQSIDDAVIIAEAKDNVEETFSGDNIEDWDTWIVMFEGKLKLCKVAEYADLLWDNKVLRGTENEATNIDSNSYQENAKLLWLNACLRGKAKEKFNKDSSSYEEAKHELEIELHKDAFNSIKEYKNTKDLKSTLLKYAERAYPGQDADIIVLQKLKELMGKKCPLQFDSMSLLITLEDTVTAFTALESINYRQYRNDDDWKAWLYCFERDANINQMEDAKKLLCLQVCISGKALEVLCSNARCDYENVKTKINAGLVERKLELSRCPKCAGNGLHPKCHTEMVNPSETTKSRFGWFCYAVIETLFSTDRICHNCHKGYGTEGCTYIGNYDDKYIHRAQHNII